MNWLAKCKAWQAQYPVVTDDHRDSPMVNSYHFSDVLSDLLTPDDVIVTDMGYAFQTTHQAFRVKHGQRFFTNCGMAAMGWGLPAAVGACIGSGRRTICITGDGGLMFNVHELATIAHHKLSVKIFVLNNAGYLTMRQSQGTAFGRRMGSDKASGVSFPLLSGLAKSFRLKYLRVASNWLIVAQIRHALASDGPMLAELVMDPEQEQMRAHGRPIEDAYPFLDPAEVAENLRIANAN